MVKILTLNIFNHNHLEFLSDHVPMHNEFMKNESPSLLQMSKRHGPCVFTCIFTEAQEHKPSLMFLLVHAAQCCTAPAW